MGIGEVSATNLALVLHELATNSVKYGALSVPTGLLDVACQINDDEAVIVWTERGGPPCIAPTPTSGFGSKLLNRIMTHQFGGSIAYDWPTEGAIVTLRLKATRLAL